MYQGISRKLLLSVLMVMSVCAWAQPPVASAPDRDKIMSELRPYQHEFLTKELKLTKEQARDFFPVYDRMDEELQQIADETRDFERRVNENANASDTEIEAASQAVFSQKEREGKLELEYYEKFKEILTPRQLLRLKSAERQFTQRLLRQHRKIKRGRETDRAARQ